MDSLVVDNITPSLTPGIDLTRAERLKLNVGIAFQGPVTVGAFDISGHLALSWLGLPNPSGVSNRAVLRPWVNGMDLVRSPAGKWIIDFGEMSEQEAAAFAAPFAYVSEFIRPNRLANRDRQRRTFWWRLGRSGSDLKAATSGLSRFICTPRVAKHRVFVWVQSETLPDSAVVAVARDDDYTLGVLHSRVHEVWSLAQGTSLEDRPRYTPSTCFETFPFPKPSEDWGNHISASTKHLDEVRNHLLASGPTITMTGLYNEVVAQQADRDPTARAFPLLLAHERLDESVAAAYGWEWPLDEEEINSRLLALNLERAAAEAGSIVDRGSRHSLEHTKAR